MSNIPRYKDVSKACVNSGVLLTKDQRFKIDPSPTAPTVLGGHRSSAKYSSRTLAAVVDIEHLSNERLKSTSSHGPHLAAKEPPVTRDEEGGRKAVDTV